jgi:S1-C subfamily serine protease
VSPSVVNVYATRIEQRAASPFANDPFFSRFFGGNDGQFQQPAAAESQALGSGVIVEAQRGDPDQSPCHTKGLPMCAIALSDGREYAVDVVIEDPNRRTWRCLRHSRAEGRHVLPAISFRRF